MGGDGGVIATKREFVRGAKSKSDEKVEEKNFKQHRLTRTRTCAQSNQNLMEPIVCCEIGNLYNKEAILTALVNKNIGVSLSHVRGLKDVKTLKFFPNPNYSIENETNGELPAMFACPITKMEFNGNHPFVAIWTTGFVLSEKAIKEVGIDSLQDEYGPFTADDLIRLVPSVEELDEQVQRMVARRSKKKAANKARNMNNTHTNNIDCNNNTESSKKRKLLPDKTSFNTTADQQFETRKSISVSSTLVRSAAVAVNGQESHSNVYKGLFHKDKEKDCKDRDLFMSVAGIRYTLR